MNVTKLSRAGGLATLVAMLSMACNSGATTPAGTGGQSGPGGQGGSATGGISGGAGGKSGQGGSSNQSGGAAGGTGGTPGGTGGAGNTGGNIGRGGTTSETHSDAAAGTSGGGGQGGSKPQADAADIAAGGAGGGSGRDGGGVSGPEVAGPDALVGNPRRVLLCDEGNRRVLVVDLQAPSTAVWSRALSDTAKYGDGMRDAQLVGGDRVAVSVLKGYVELDIKTGEVKKEVTSFDGVESLRRLPSGNTVLGSNSNGGVTLQELDSKDAPVPSHKVTFTSYSQLRLMRRTPQGTFLIGVGQKLAEVGWDKQTVWEMSIPGGDNVYQGLRLQKDTVAVTSGYGVSILVIDYAAKKVLTTIGGKSQPDAATIVPNFYAGFQLLPNGHLVVTNWEGHGGGNGGKGLQLLEYDATGALVWKWKQDPGLVSSLHNVIVLDGLDTTKLHDDVNGALAPITE